MTSIPAESFRQFLLSPARIQKSCAALILVITVLTLFSPILFSGNLLVSIPDGDLANQFYAWRQFGFTELAKGHLPLWNPYIYCGAPYFAGFQSALLYPPNWLFLILPLVFALNFSITLHVFLAGYFTYIWLAENRLSFLPALFGSFVFMLGGAYFAHVTPGHLTNLCAMAWIPLVFLSLEKLLGSPNLQNLLAGAGILSLQLLSGHPQYFLYTVFFAILYALAHILREPSRWTRQTPAFFAFLAIAAALTAIQWMPAWAASLEFGRDHSSGSDNGFFSMNPLGLVTLLAPDFFGGSSPHSYFINNRIWWEITPFIGGTAFLFALNTFCRGGLAQNRIPLGLTLLAVLLSFGSYTFLYSLLERLPLFHSFRGSFKFLILAQAFIALLSAKGFQSWLAEEIPSKFLSKWAFGFSVVFILAAAWTWMGFWPWKECLASSSLAALGFLIFGFLGWSGRTSGKIALAFLGMLSLWLFAQSHLPSFDVQAWQAEGEPLRTALGPNLGDGRVFWAAHNNRSMSLGFSDIWGDDPLAPKRLGAFLTYRKEPIANASPDTQFLNLTPVKAALTRLAYLINRKPAGFEPSPWSFPRLPRLLLVGGFQKVTDIKEAFEALSAPSFNPQSKVILEETPDPLPVENGGKGRMTIKSHTTDWLELKVETDQPQILLITDNYAKGWKALAYPDSAQKRYEVMPGDAIARAIPLSAGIHHFDLVYDAPGFTAGKWISAFSFLTYLLAWGWVWRRKTNI